MRLLVILLLLPSSSKANDTGKRTIYDAIGAIMSIESGFDRFAHNKKENALGVLQIRPIMVKEVNSILGWDKYHLNDRIDINKSIEMFVVFQKHRNPSGYLEKGVRCWNGGCNGHKKDSTIKYYKKVMKVLNSQ